MNVQEVSENVSMLEWLWSDSVAFEVAFIYLYQLTCIELL